MPMEATPGTGAEMAEIETMFDDEPGNPATGDQAALDQVTGTQQNDDTNLDDRSGADLNGDPDLQLDLTGDDTQVEVDPNAQQQAELVIPDDHKVKLTVDGKEVEYSFGDLKASAQKFEGANRRFEEAAAIRKEYTEKAQGLSTREQQLGQVLEYYIGQSNAMMQASQPDWAKLLAEDPQEYLVQRHNWEQKEIQLRQAQQVQANLQRQQAEQSAALAQTRAAEERVKLVAAIPDWADPNKAAEGARQIDGYLASQGVTPEMRAQIDTAGVLLIARKAMLYDQAIAKQQAARKAGASAAAAAQQQTQQRQQQVRQTQGRVERPGAASPAQTAASRQNLSKANAAKAFNANPSIDTLAGLFE